MARGGQRELELDRRFEGILAWDSFFHLGMEDQREMLPRFAAHARRGAALMFTSGLAEGEAIGSCCEEPLYHASLGPAEYEQLLTTNGYVVRAYVAEDPRCGKHTVWLGPGNSRRARFRVCAAQAERGDVGRLRVDVGKIAGKTSGEVFVEEELHGPAGARRTRRLRRLERARTAPCRCSG